MTPEPHTPRPPLGDEPARILLIEDDEAQARAMTRWLEADGRITVAHAATGFTAEALLESGARWDAVVSDIDLPGMNGLQVLELCKTHQPDVPVLMVTAHRKFDYVLEALRGRAHDFMIKPLEKALFGAKVDELVALGRSRRRGAGRDVVLAVGAHPDDVEIGVGGVLLRHAARGDEVVVATLSGGEAGGEPGMRLKEAQAAAAAMGAQLRIFDLPDRRISDGPETIAVLEAVIREVQPSIVYTHSANDAHQDHRAVHQATLVAARGVPNVYCYQAPSTTVSFKPSLFVNVAEQLEQKLQVLELYGSQTGIRKYLAPELIRSTAAYWGRFSDYNAAEPLEVVRRTA